MKYSHLLFSIFLLGFGCGLADLPDDAESEAKANSISVNSEDARFTFETKDTRATKFGDTVMDADGPNDISIGIVLRGISVAGTYPVGKGTETVPLINVDIRDAKGTVMYDATTATEATVQFAPLRVKLSNVKMIANEFESLGYSAEKPFTIKEVDGTWNTVGGRE